MKEIVSEKKFFISTLLTLFSLLTITSIFAYIIDPAQYYRLANYKAYNTELYTTAGLINNYPAEIAVIGSSMMQNTDLKLVRELFEKDAIKYTLSGMTVDETVMLVNRSIEVNNTVDTFIINLDITTFNTPTTNPFKRFPQYLYDSNKLNDIKYLLGFDTWMKFIPFNILYNIATIKDSAITNKIVEVFSNPTDIDLIGNWGINAKFGNDIVLSNYKNDFSNVSIQNTDGMIERMIQRFENDFLDKLPLNNIHKEFIFILPPYSILMWDNAEKEGYLDILFDFKSYLITKLEQFENVKIYDFQDYEGIIDLNEYKDMTHYSPNYNNMMMSYIANYNESTTSDNISMKIEKIKELLYSFQNDNLYKY